MYIDARPSDALALSLRAKAPVFVDTQVLDEAKSVDVSSDEADRERLQRWLESLDPDDLGYKM
jgi:bifunctional DNase/RNase